MIIIFCLNDSNMNIVGTDKMNRAQTFWEQRKGQPVNMDIEERREAIIDYLQYHPNCNVNQVIELFNVTPATVRRDLTYLEQEGKILRSHGSVHLKSARPVSDFSARSQSFSAEKKAIAKAALQFVRPRDCVVLDSGTTANAVAEEVSKVDSVVLVTNSLSIATAKSSAHEVFLSGGVVDLDNLSLIGPDAERFFERISASVAFIGTTGIRGSSGPTVISPFFASIKRKMMDCAERKVLIFDNSKLNPVGMITFAGFEEFDAIVVSQPLKDEALLQYLNEHKVPVVVAETAGGAHG